MFIESWNLQAFAAYRHRCSSEACQLLHPEVPPDDYLQLLLEKDMHVDAVRLLAYLLPRRAAVWWGCLCVWDAARRALSGHDAAAIERVVRWVVEPSEANRRAVAAHADLNTPARCLAFAVFWSGGSVVAAELPPVEPPVHVLPATIGPAVLLIAAEHAPRQLQAAIRRLLAIGLQVAEGKHVWEAEAAAAEQAPPPARAAAEVVGLTELASQA